MNNAAIAATLRTAATDLRSRDRFPDYIDQWGYGGTAYVLLFEAASKLFGWPAVEAMQRHLHVRQLQHVHKNREELATDMERAADALDAGHLGTADELEAAALRAKLIEIRDRLVIAADIRDPARGHAAIVTDLISDVMLRSSLANSQVPDTARKLIDAGAISVVDRFVITCACHQQPLADETGGAVEFGSVAEAIDVAIDSGWHLSTDGRLCCV